MTKAQFGNYRFSIRTQIQIDGEWYKIVGVLFGEYTVRLEGGSRIGYDEIEDIKEAED